MEVAYADYEGEEFFTGGLDHPFYLRELKRWRGKLLNGDVNMATAKWKLRLALEAEGFADVDSGFLAKVLEICVSQHGYRDMARGGA